MRSVRYGEITRLWHDPSPRRAPGLLTTSRSILTFFESVTRSCPASLSPIQGRGATPRGLNKLRVVDAALLPLSPRRGEGCSAPVHGSRADDTKPECVC